MDTKRINYWLIAPGKEEPPPKKMIDFTPRGEELNQI